MSRLACVLLTKIGERISASATRGMHAELIEERHLPGRRFCPCADK